MTCIVLAAGYATRLYPITENFPKPLLSIDGKTIIDRIIDDLFEKKAIDRCVVVTNHKFAKKFRDWQIKKSQNITIIDDGSETNETRLGAVNDIAFAREKAKIDDDVLVVAGDNLLDFSLNELILYAKAKNTSCIMYYDEVETDKLSKRGVIELDGERVISMEEKPANPKSNLCVPPFYFYTKNDLSKIGEAIKNGIETDAPGSYLSWLCERTEINAMKMKGSRTDIGNLNDYYKATGSTKRVRTPGDISHDGGRRDAILVTGAAGFIGFHLCRRLLSEGYYVIGFDNVNDYYQTSLKESRIKILRSEGKRNFRFIRDNICHYSSLKKVFEENNIRTAVHLAAQAGVRYSIDNPREYIKSNIIGTFNILECCRYYQPNHLLYASSSSVYGNRKEVPFRVSDDVSRPVSLYAATKKSDELMAYTYSSLYGIPATGLRFFTVYGPWGRPDMAYFKFTDKIMRGEPIQLYNNGDMLRDFTYVDDIISGIMNIIPRPPECDPDGVRAKIYNIGNNSPVPLSRFVSILESAVGKKAVIEFLPMQKGDVYQTYADVDDLIREFDFKPDTPLEYGLFEFAKWYKEYYKI